jgi:hypothetical protein
MSTWLSHLQIADSLSSALPSVSRDDLLIGSIAPDCGLPATDGFGFVPEKCVSHFLAPGIRTPAERPYNFDEVRFWRGHTQDLRGDFSNPKSAYLLGYFTHLVVDNLWAYAVGIVTKERFVEPARDKAKAWKAVKADWYDADVARIRNNPADSAWLRFTEIRHPRSYLPLMPTKNVAVQVPRIVDRYSWLLIEPAPGESRQFSYFSANHAERFVSAGKAVARRVVEDLLDGGAAHLRPGAISFVSPSEFTEATSKTWEAHPRANPDAQAE